MSTPPNPSGVGALELAIRAGMDSLEVDLHTSLPGVVVEFFEADQTADVQVEVLRLPKRGPATPVPLLCRVPVYLARAGGFSVCLPVAAGDQVLVVFLERDIDRWLIEGGPQEPATRRRHDFSDAVAYPGLTSDSNRLGGYSTSALQIRNDAGTQMVELRADGTIHINGVGEVHLLADAIRLGSSGTDLVAEVIALCSAVEDLLTDGGDLMSAQSIAEVSAIRAKIEGIET